MVQRMPGSLGTSILPMGNPIRDYDWGARETLARLQGREPSGTPEAELWMGAHPSAPSIVMVADGAVHRLDELVSRAPHDVLGADVATTYGPRLPYLLKVLAIASPLSLQVHPDRTRARDGFAGEVEVLGEHRYVDPYPKPEMLYALEPIEALCGFRPAPDAARLLRLLDGRRLAAIAAPLHDPHPEDDTDALEAAFEILVTWPDDDRADLALEAADAAETALPAAGLTDDDRAALTWVTRLAEFFPKDGLVVAPLLLDLVRLRSGETLFVPAGAPHSYLSGTGVEIMGNSDNVLRAGLTHKPIAVEELLHVVDGRSRPHRTPEIALGPCEVGWRPEAPEFQLTRVRLPDGSPVEACGGLPGPQIVLATAGVVEVRCDGETYTLRGGESALVPAGCGPLVLAGPGEVFRAAVGSTTLP
jgi:mannose-6-phosphate isomerase